MTQRKSLARKLIVLFIVLVILIPCSVLVYDTVVSSNEERVDFYYMMSDGGMGALKKNIPRTDREEMLKNVLAILQEGPNADGATASMPQNLEIRSVTLEQATVTVDFSEEYLQMNDLEETICRSSVVWTLTSLDFVKNVRILVEGEPLKNQNGEAYAIFNRDNVWIDTEISAETTGYAILTLYFANAEGTDLVAEERVVEVNANQTREKTVLEQLIAGPEEKGSVATIPVGTKIKDVTTTDDGTCYVNLSQEFVLKHTGGEREELLTIYSIVNSLCELDQIDRVQFLVEGKKLDTYKDNLQFKTPFTAVDSIRRLEEKQEENRNEASDTLDNNFHDLWNIYETGHIESDMSGLFSFSALFSVSFCDKQEKACLSAASVLCSAWILFGRGALAGRAEPFDKNRNRRGRDSGRRRNYLRQSEADPSL